MNTQGMTIWDTVDCSKSSKQRLDVGVHGDAGDS